MNKLSSQTARTKVMSLAVIVTLLMCATNCSEQEPYVVDSQSNPKKTMIAPGNLASAAVLGTPGIAGVNWADARDNFVDG